MFRKKKVKKLDYDPRRKYPVLRCSICNGEKVAGIKDRLDGSFEEVMFVRTEQDLADFQTMVGTADIPKEY